MSIISLQKYIRMASKIIKDFEKRKKYFKKYYTKKKIYLSFNRNPNLSLEERTNSYILMTKSTKLSKVKFVNYCSYSQTPRSINKNTKLSRHKFKNLALNGLLPGWGISSW